MENGDLATWETKRILTILEGVYCRPQRKGLRKRWVSPDEWEWQLLPLKSVARYAFNNIPVDVITFLGEDVADLAMAWLIKYDVDASSMIYHDYEMFCESLKWRPQAEIVHIVDSNVDRLSHYGQLGYQIPWGGAF